MSRDDQGTSASVSNRRAARRACLTLALAGAGLVFGFGCSSDVQYAPASGSGGGSSSSGSGSSSSGGGSSSSGGGSSSSGSGSSSGGGGSSSGGGGSSSGGGGGAPCVSAGDCGPVSPDGCSTPACNAGQCVVELAPSGMDSAQQTPADCQRAVCDGAGGVTEIPDDLDLPKGSPCLVASCNNGVPVSTPAGVAVACNGTCHCDGVGACAGPGCVSDAICPQDPAGCFIGKCVGCEVCIAVNAPAGQPTGLGPKGDCKVVVCNGSGGTMSAIDDSDLPDDKDPCTLDVCANGVPMNPPLCPPPQTCNQGVCTP